MEASDTCFSFSIVSWRICSCNRPISAACSVIRLSSSIMSSGVTPWAVKRSSAIIGRCSSVMVPLSASISPLPVNSQSALILNCDTIFCIADVPTLLLPLDISVTIEALIPNLAAKSRLSLTCFFVSNASYASMKRADISFFASIIQNIEFFSSKNLVFNTEYCIFATCSKWSERPKILKWRENNEF